MNDYCKVASSEPNCSPLYDNFSGVVPGAKLALRWLGRTQH